MRGRLIAVSGSAAVAAGMWLTLAEPGVLAQAQGLGIFTGSADVGSPSTIGPGSSYV